MTEREKIKENSPEHRLLFYMTGWRCGAGARAITEEQQSDRDFMEGWEEGRNAVKLAYGSACTKYETMLNVLRIQSEGKIQ